MNSLPDWLFALIAELIGLRMIGVIFVWLFDACERSARGQAADDEWFLHSKPIGSRIALSQSREDGPPGGGVSRWMTQWSVPAP